ncbi:MAG: glycosyltransferase WbsX family protein [Desulfobulbaceae bacterium]
MVVAYLAKLCMLRNETWYREHLSRFRHEKAYLRALAFDHGRYGQWLIKKVRKPSSDFAPLSGEFYCRSNRFDSIKPIAFYLPQFHQIPENNEWHGRGFTDWTNVTRALPQFVGHHQPQLPIDVGFYDLTHPDVMFRQVELARQYGIYGFCFHYYWFSGGKRLLEKPVFNWLANRDLDFPFCLNWANENWSKLWDGGNRQVLMKQENREEDAEPFFKDILPFFQDPRYIRLDGKPLLIIYRPNLFKKEAFLGFTNRLRAVASDHGLDGLYLAMVYCDYFEDNPKDWGLDAAVEFPPQRVVEHRQYVTDGNPVNPDFKGYVYSLNEAIESGALVETNPDFPLFRGIFPAWDNSARKAYSNASVYLQSPAMYRKWLSKLIKWTQEHHEADRQFIFINAWNEWAEGAHLEPDNRHGYAYLQATKEALENSRR